MTIYSIRTNLGRELWWTTSRKAALQTSADFTSWGFVDGRHGGDAKPFQSHELPLLVYKSSVVKV